MKNNEKEEKIVSAFNKIRDFPYEIYLGKDSSNDYKEKIAQFKRCKRGSCSLKHYLLGTICEELDCLVEYLTFPFYWDELEIDYPSCIKNLARVVPLTYHLAIKVEINGPEFLLDATWDSPLKKVGFPVNRVNYLMNTKLAIVPCGKPIIHHTIPEREGFVRIINGTRGRKVSPKEVDFYTALNAWLDDLRK